MLNSSSEFSKKTLQIKQDDKFFSSLLSKESSIANPSFRVYYGGVSGAVPFMWESQPGTPKNKLCETSLPPLTPPPSYYCTNNEKSTKKNSRSKLLNTLFLRINVKKSNRMPPSSPSSSISSWSSSPWSSSMRSSTTSTASTNIKSYRSRRRFLSQGCSFDGSIDYDEVSTTGSSAGSVLCFGINNRNNSKYSVVIVKKALLSMVGRGSV